MKNFDWKIIRDDAGQRQVMWECERCGSAAYVAIESGGKETFYQGRLYEMVWKIGLDCRFSHCWVSR
jgi:hypothetical protein